MSPRRPMPDPLAVARALADEAERAADGSWRRVLLTQAWFHLADARAAIPDAEAGLRGYESSPVAEMMRTTVENRRREIERIAARFDALEGQSGGEKS